MEFLGVVIGPEGIKMEKEKSKRSLGVADTEVCQGRAKILRAGQLLLLVYRRICNGGKALT